MIKHVNKKAFNKNWFKLTLEKDDTAESRRSWDWLLGGGSTVLPNPA